jgi:hypothetical protein
MKRKLEIETRPDLDGEDPERYPYLRKICHEFGDLKIKLDSMVLRLDSLASEIEKQKERNFDIPQKGEMNKASKITEKDKEINEYSHIHGIKKASAEYKISNRTIVRIRKKTGNEKKSEGESDIDKTPKKTEENMNMNSGYNPTKDSIITTKETSYRRNRKPAKYQEMEVWLNKKKLFYGLKKKNYSTG